MNFCIETALKFQTEDSRLIAYDEVFEDVIESIKDDVIIWDKSIHTSEFLLPWGEEKAEPRKPILTLKKGQTIVGHARDHEDALDEWSISSKQIPSMTDTLPYGWGYVAKVDVKVTQRKKNNHLT